MNGVQNWGYSSLMINGRTLESISCPKPVLPLQMVIRPCFEALQVLWCRCRSHDGGWEGIPCCNRSVRKWSQDGVVGLSREGNRELERVRLGELASRSWLRRRRSLWGEQVGERREARTTHQFKLWSRQRLLTLRRRARLSTLTPGPIRERARFWILSRRERW